ncbi:meiosis-specific protein ASY3 isoform X2 [Benincasa hispida]|uniref:meiosis-specific protein ASY3 isoform X2 n=1 Tax=Benincasa hispida TaxID=102211 RepID=UPI0019024422|nr:meiosis-specific protein ASY3 isoform X2 [Benincasa hispida]
MTEAKVGWQPNLRDDPLSDCRSFGSNCHPSSQSRKISIGIMVESPTNGKCRSTKELKSMVPNAEVLFSRLENSTKGNWKEKDTRTFGTNVKSKLSEAPQQCTSPWVSTRSLKRNAPLMDIPSGAERMFHSPTTCGRQNKGHGLKEPPATCSVRSFANQSSMLKSGNSKEKNFDEANCQMEGVRDTTNEKLHEFAFATMTEVRSDKMVIEDQANKSENRTETLKMKLWEILGTVSVPNDQHSECQNHEQDVNQLITEEIVVQKHERAVRFKNNSDTIETDSENSGQTLKRPIVRSIARKRSHIFVQSRKSKTPSGNKGKHQEGNVFIFEGGPEDTHVAINGPSTMCTRKKSGEKSFKFQPRKILFPQKEEKMGTFPKPTGIEELAPQEKPSSFREVQGFHSSPVNHVTVEKDERKGFNQFPQMDKTVSPGNFHSPADYGQQGGIDNAFLDKDVDPQSRIESPTFRMKTPVCSSPSSTPKADKVVCESSSPGSVGEILSTRNICSFRKLRTSEEDCDRSNVKPHFSEDDKEIEHSPLEKASADLTKGAADYRLSDSSSEDASYESYAEDSSQRDTLSPEIGSIKKFKSMLRPAKRARNVENDEFDFNGPRESSWAEEILFPNEEDGLARAAKLFLSELEKLKSKISSISIEKSSEVLLSVAESIHLQLQNVESQIQTDMVKLLSFGKSRRKDLETKFEEQQQQLNRINKKFKEEVNQHLQDCRNSLQELEAQQIEFKGIMEKKKASHRNNLLQVEEEVDMQLKDAQRRIEAIHKSGRGKILQLKQAIAMCLK